MPGSAKLAAALPVNGGPAGGSSQQPLIVVDPDQRRVLVSGHDAGLVFKEYELLSFLAANPGRVFTRAHLLASVWGDDYDGTPRTVDVHVHRLRRKLGPVYARSLVTIRRVGYLYRPPSPCPRAAGLADVASPSSGHG